jgi:hypothetical protein
MGRNYTLGDVVPFEWGAGKTFNLNNDIFKRVALGAARIPAGPRHKT